MRDENVRCARTQLEDLNCCWCMVKNGYSGIKLSFRGGKRREYLYMARTRIRIRICFLGVLARVRGGYLGWY